MMAYLLGSLVALRPFVCDPVHASFAMLADLAICLCATLVFAGRYRNAPLRLSDGVLFGLALACFWSLPGSVNKYLTLKQTLMFCVYASVFIAVRRFSPQEQRWLLGSILAASSIIALRALYQFFGGFAYLEQDAATQQITRTNFYVLELIRQRRVISWFAAPNILSSYLIAILPFAAGEGIGSWRRGRVRHAVLCSAGATLVAIALLLTKAVGAVMALAGAAIFCGMFLRRRPLAGVARRLGIVAGIALALACVSVIALRGATLFDAQHPQNSAVQRGYYWQSALQLMAKHPWQGSGAGTFAILYPRVKHPQANETAFAHNIFLQFGAETGVVGLGALVVLLVGMMRALRSADNSTSRLLLLGSTAFLVHNIVDYTLFIPQAAICWAALFASGTHRERAAHPPQKMNWRWSMPHAGWFIMFAMILYQLGLVYAGERKIEQGIARFNQKAPAQACQYWRTASQLIPWADTPYYLLARSAAQEHTPQASARVIRYYEEAIARNPQYAFYYFYLAEYFARKQDTARALRFLTKARAAYPRYERFETAWRQLQQFRSLP